MPHFSGDNRWRIESYDWCTAHLDELAEKRSSAARAMFDKHEAEQKAKRAATPTARPAKGKEAF
jgi:limonene 1,2-monooxygenase